MTRDSKTCNHARTQLVAQDSDATYVECLDCGAILEGEELAEEQRKKEGFDES
jgi:translation initiation factor 2 beta subunit (eIF-2beta)/eIF-5